MFIQYYYRDFVKICKTKFQETFCKILPWFMVNYLQVWVYLIHLKQSEFATIKFTKQCEISSKHDASSK